MVLPGKQCEVTMDFANETGRLLESIGVSSSACRDGDLEVTTPIDGSVIARVPTDGTATIDERIARAQEAFLAWRAVPPPVRGELVRRWGDALRANKDALGRLVSIESGKILSEGAGEVQEMIDICDLAVGQSRQLYGLTIASERAGHHMLERWHPLGPVGVVTAFNFPVAVFCWNAALGLVCGNSVRWKPSERTPLAAIATLHLLHRAAAELADLPVPPRLAQLVLGGRAAAAQLADDVEFVQQVRDSAKVALLSALEQSMRHGLSPSDYHLEALRHAHARAEEASALERANLDIMATDALARYAYHLRFCKVNPEELEPSWNFTRALVGTNPVDARNAVIDGDDPGTSRHDSFGGPDQTGEPLWAPVSVSGETGEWETPATPRTTTSCRRGTSTA
jgi:hypothetical protein